MSKEELKDYEEDLPDYENNINNNDLPDYENNNNDLKDYEEDNLPYYEDNLPDYEDNNNINNDLKDYDDNLPDYEDNNNINNDLKDYEDNNNINNNLKDYEDNNINDLKDEYEDILCLDNPCSLYTINFKLNNKNKKLMLFGDIHGTDEKIKCRDFIKNHINLVDFIKLLLKINSDKYIDLFLEIPTFDISYSSKVSMSFVEHNSYIIHLYYEFIKYCEASYTPITEQKILKNLLEFTKIKTHNNLNLRLHNTDFRDYKDNKYLYLINKISNFNLYINDNEMVIFSDYNTIDENLHENLFMDVKKMNDILNEIILSNPNNSNFNLFDILINSDQINIIFNNIYIEYKNIFSNFFKNKLSFQIDDLKTILYNINMIYSNYIKYYPPSKYNNENFNREDYNQIWKVMSRTNKEYVENFKKLCYEYLVKFSYVMDFLNVLKLLINYESYMDIEKYDVCRHNYTKKPENFIIFAGDKHIRNIIEFFNYAKSINNNLVNKIKRHKICNYYNEYSEDFRTIKNISSEIINYFSKNKKNNLLKNIFSKELYTSFNKDDFFYNNYSIVKNLDNYINTIINIKNNIKNMMYKCFKINKIKSMKKNEILGDINFGVFIKNNEIKSNNDYILVSYFHYNKVDKYNCFILYNVCTNIKYTKKGYFSKLFTKSLLHLKTIYPKYENIYLFVKNNKQNAIKLYLKLGFKIVILSNVHTDFSYNNPTITKLLLNEESIYIDNIKKSHHSNEEYINKYTMILSLKD